MQVIAVVRTDGDWYAVIRNQWGRAHNGSNCFVVELEHFDQWLRSANCLTIGELQQREAVELNPFAKETLL